MHRSPQGSFVNDGKANLLATAAEQTSSSATWGGGSFATWDAATVTSVTLSGGDLVATNAGTTSLDQGARVATANGKTSGKYYHEVTITTKTSGSNAIGIGVGTTASTYTNMQTSGTAGATLYIGGTSPITASSAGGISLGAIVAGDIVRIATDLDNRKIWFRRSAATNWNNTVGADPGD